MNIMAKVDEVIEEKHDYPVVGESYVVGKAEDGRYFFSWGPEYPKEGEDGDDVVPSYNIEAGESGISFHNTVDAALKEMQDAVSAVEGE